MRALRRTASQLALTPKFCSPSNRLYYLNCMEVILHIVAGP